VQPGTGDVDGFFKYLTIIYIFYIIFSGIVLGGSFMEMYFVYFVIAIVLIGLAIADINDSKK